MGTRQGSILDHIGVAVAQKFAAISRGRATLNREEFMAGYRCGYRAGVRAAREELERGGLSEVAEREVAGERKTA